MNREIKFRGKLEYNGKWIYGDLLQYENEDIAIFGEKLSSFGYECTEMSKRDRVIPGTVGQYTGVKDSTGKEIYEGDIVTIGLWTALVTWNEEFATFALRFDFENKVGRKSLGEWEDTIVIGNIHDNPELLKQ